MAALTPEHRAKIAAAVRAANERRRAQASAARPAPPPMKPLPDGIVIPSDEYGPARAFLALALGVRDDHDKSLWQVAFGLQAGRVEQVVGEPIPYRKALALVRAINERVDAR